MISTTDSPHHLIKFRRLSRNIGQGESLDYPVIKISNLCNFI